jgi:hypothetical protein
MQFLGRFTGKEPVGCAGNFKFYSETLFYAVRIRFFFFPFKSNSPYPGISRMPQESCGSL